MTEEQSSSPVLPALSGVAIGVLVFLGVTIWSGEPIIPTVEGAKAVTTYPAPPPSEQPGAGEAGPAIPDDGEGIYNAVCVTCHQADGQGMPGAFPPLAGSDWVTADVETPIRIVLKGLSGPIDVKGKSFNSVMPPQGQQLNDAQIAEVLTYVRSNFGNSAGAVEEATVAEVRSAVEGRAQPWSAEELKAQRPAGGSAAAQPAEGEQPAAAGEGVEGEQPAAGEAAPAAATDAVQQAQDQADAPAAAPAAGSDGRAPANPAQPAE